MTGCVSSELGDLRHLDTLSLRRVSPKRLTHVILWYLSGFRPAPEGANHSALVHPAAGSRER